MKSKALPIIFTGVSLAALPLTGRADTTLFSDNYDSLAGSPITAAANGTFNGYTVNMLTTDNRVIFGYDYSVANLGIPSAPHSTGGTQTGVRFDANRTLGVISSLAISPNSTFSGDFTLHFDMWMNSIGPFPGGGTSSSENLTAGVGYNGTSVQNNTSGSGVWTSVTGDGGFSGTSATPDYQARIGTALQAATTPGVYAAGTATGSVGSSVDNANAYYTTRFPSQPYPAAQVTAFPANQTGTPPAGGVLFSWHDVAINRSGTTVTWWIDNNLIATVTSASATATDAIDIGFWDPGASSANQTSGLVFGLIDNLSVTVPEPSVLGLAILGGGMLFAKRRKK